jgi:phosphopantetheinyl transferase (holo-ACP synthase)
MAHGELWQKVLAHLVLSRGERETWRKLQKSTFRRRLDWLRGRVAAKDAVLFLVKTRYKLDLGPADVEIITGDQGRPVVQGTWITQIHEPILLSLAHSHEMAVAISRFGKDGSETQGIGVDLEWVDTNHQSNLILTESEQALLANKQTHPEEAWLLRLWCAKEAVGKSFGVGLAGSMEQIIATDFDPQTGIVQIKLAGKMADKFPQNGQLLTVNTLRDNNYVVASVI